MLRIGLHEDGMHFRAVGGDPKGGDRVNEIVSGWPGWQRTTASASASTYIGPRNIASALALSGTTIQLSWDPLAHNLCRNLLTDFRELRRLLQEHKALRAEEFSFGQKLTERKPHTHQIAGVAAIARLGGRCLLSDDMGLGKTAQALWFASEVCVNRILVVCPASVKWNWPKEVLETLGGTWPTQVIDGSPKQRANQFSALGALWKNHHRLVIVINYDLLSWLTDEHLQRLSRFVDGQLCILDESHRVKNMHAECTRIVRKMFCPFTGGARFRIAIDGTPLWNTVDDLYSQIELVRPGTFHSLHWFLNRYTVQSQITVGKKTVRKNGRLVEIPIKRDVTRKAKNERELNLILNTLQVRRKKSEVTDLPPKVFTYSELELDEKSAKIYVAMRDFALLLLEKLGDDTPILSPIAKSALEAAARCAQIAQGCVGGVPEELLVKHASLFASAAERVKNKHGWLVFPKSAKLVWIQEKLDEVSRQGGSVGVFSQYNAPLLWLQEKRGGVAIVGGLDPRVRQESFDAFQGGSLRELYIQIRIAQGFNLHRGQDVLFLGRDWAAAPNEQAVDRFHRIGQTGTVNVQIPIMRKTVEVKQHRALAEKHRTAEDVLCFRTVADLKSALA